MVRLDLIEVDDDQPPFAVFEGKIPTSRERKAIERGGYGLNLITVPNTHADLEFLADFAPFLRELAIASPNVIDARSVLSLPYLRKLSLVTSQASLLELNELAELTDFGGELQFHEAVLACTSLRRASFQGAGRGSLGRIAAPLVELELVDLGRSDLALDLVDPSTLKNLSITGSERIDVRDLRHLTGLEVLELAECAEVVGLERLASLESLRVLVFENCRSLDPLESLLSIDVERVAVVDRNPFDTDFRQRAAESAAEWVYFGSARRASKP